MAIAKRKSVKSSGAKKAARSNKIVKTTNTALGVHPTTGKSYGVFRPTSAGHLLLLFQYQTLAGAKKCCAEGMRVHSMAVVTETSPGTYILNSYAKRKASLLAAKKKLAEREAAKKAAEMERLAGTPLMTGEY